MRVLWCLVLVLVVAACSQSSPAPQLPLPSVGGVPEATESDELMAAGIAALRTEKWSEAAGYLAVVLDRAEDADRSDAAFFLGYALYKHGESMARANSSGDEQVQLEVHELMRRSREALLQTEDPRREGILKGIKQYLPVEIADGRN